MSVHEITVEVNGRSHVVTVEARRLLSDLLREDLRLTGTKVSCGVQVCGACTVLVDGQPVSACTFLAVDVDGCAVRTVEGVAGADGSLSSVQQAFVDNHALQCGFCTPGFIMATEALLATAPDADDREVAHHLEGNLCRCTGYASIVAAVRQALDQQRGHTVEQGGQDG